MAFGGISSRLAWFGDKDNGHKGLNSMAKTNRSPRHGNPETMQIQQFTLAELEAAAFRELDAISSVLWSARAFKEKISQPFTYTITNHENGEETPQTIAPTPAHRLLAEYLALYEFDGFPVYGYHAMVWLERSIMAGRQSLISLSSGPRSSAFGLVWMLPESALPVPEDPFQTNSLFRELWRLLAADSELGDQPSADGRSTLKKMSPMLRSDHHDLSVALSTAFSGEDDLPRNWFSPVHQKLARAIAGDKPIRRALKEVRISDLADYLHDLASDHDLLVIRQEMRLEFARVEERVASLIPPYKSVQIGPESNLQPSRKRGLKPDARGQFAYRLLMKDITLKEAKTQFNAEADKREWEEIESPNGLKWLAQNYANLHGKPPIPPRKQR